MGIFGNAAVLLAYMHIIYSEPKLLPVDMILCHLAFANLLLLLTRCVPQTMTVFGLRDLLNDAGCKVVIYAYRIGRALSVCITCLWFLNMAICIAAPFFSMAPRNVARSGASGALKQKPIPVQSLQ
uniref:Vomeronasal type-1 receptor n=1 Tax=Knipowitschia caucasica TaxID=637954 RepID=A0AAV2M757_KNICA